MQIIWFYLSIPHFGPSIIEIFHPEYPKGIQVHPKSHERREKEDYLNPLLLLYQFYFIWAGQQLVFYTLRE